MQQPNYSPDQNLTASDSVVIRAKRYSPARPYLAFADTLLGCRIRLVFY